MLLALNGRMTRSIMSRWLIGKGVHTHEASDWNELTLNLQELFKSRVPNEPSLDSSIKSVFIIIIDIGLLDLSTDLWKQQLNFLEEYCNGRASFVWILNHDTSNAIKAELRKRGHLLMVNKPLYKAKLVQIFEAVIKRERDQTPAPDELLEIDPLQSPSASSDDSEKLENENCTMINQSCQNKAKRGQYFSRTPPNGDHIQLNLENDVCSLSNPVQERHKQRQHFTKPSNEEEQGGASSYKAVNEQKPLEGLCILLAEDTIVLQRVATIMLERMGAKVVVVGDGVQTVDSLTERIQPNEERDERSEEIEAKALPYDLILMDCQVSPNTIIYSKFSTKLLRVYDIHC